MDYASSSSRTSTNHRITYEESEQKVQRLQEAINAAAAVKNFERSAQLQVLLDKHMILHNKLTAEKQAVNHDDFINSLESSKLDKESQLLRTIINQMQSICELYDADYVELEKRYNEKILELQNTFSRPKYTTIPLSSNMRVLQRAESFYAKNKDFQAAAAIRNQIRQQSQREMSEFKQSTSNTIDAKIRDAVKKYQTEQKCFSQRLENEKNLLKKDILKTITGLDNQYKKLLKKQTGIVNYDFGFLTEFKETVFRLVDSEFENFARSLQEQYNSPTPCSGPTLEAPEPRPLQTLPYQTLKRTQTSRGLKSSRAPRRYDRTMNNSIRMDDDLVQNALTRRNRAFDISQPLSAH